MKIYNKQNVYEAALDRIRYIYDEFDTVIVAFSGGKDSTVILELTIIVAKEKNRLPVPVYFIDEEADLQMTIDYVERTFKREEVKPFWFQIPFKLFNSCSFFDKWLFAWEEKEKENWIRPKHPMAITEGIFQETGKIEDGQEYKEWYNFFPKINHWISKQVSGKEGNCAALNGIKCDESMARKKFLTTHPAYKDICWSAAKQEDKETKNIRFSPLYDWSVDDIWTAISKNDWDYNTYYDKVYQFGGAIGKMRVSSVIHSTAAEYHLMMLQQIEPETYDKLTKRLGGVSTYSKLLQDIKVTQIPSMFGSWEEYTHYLINTIIEEDKRQYFFGMINSLKPLMEKIPSKKEEAYRNLVPIVLANDFGGAKFSNLREKLKMKYKFDLI